MHSCRHVGNRLLEGISVNLGMPQKHLSAAFEERDSSFLRLNYYPVDDPLAGTRIEHQPTADLGVHHHTDAGALTVLMQDDVGGLQVYRDGYWHDVPSIPGAMVINTGDMMQVWSNDVYQAAIHRVLAMDTKNRYSLPFFFNPAAASKVSPLPTMVSDQRPSRYNTIEWASFRGKRTDGDYANYGTEVQISQFRK